MKSKTIKFNFKNSNGEDLSGLLDITKEPPIGFAIFAPCFTCTKESHAAYKVAKALLEYNIATLRFDTTGIGESKGEFTTADFSMRVRDIICASEALEKEYSTPKILIGHSLSGIAGIVAAKDLSDIQLLVTLGSPQDPAHIVKTLEKNNLLIRHENNVELIVGGKHFTVGTEFVDDMLSYDMDFETAQYDNKLMVIHAPHDNMVAFKNAQEIYNRADCDKELITMPENATHLHENGMNDALFIAGVIGDWVRTHLQ